MPSAAGEQRRVLRSGVRVAILAEHERPPLLWAYGAEFFEFLRRMRTTPARPADLLLAQLVVHAVAALLSAMIVLALGRGVYDVVLPRHPLAHLVTLALGALAGLASGALITAVSRTAKMASAAGLAIFFPAVGLHGVITRGEQL